MLLEIRKKIEIGDERKIASKNEFDYCVQRKILHNINQKRGKSKLVWHHQAKLLTSILKIQNNLNGIDAKCRFCSYNITYNYFLLQKHSPSTSHKRRHWLKIYLLYNKILKLISLFLLKHITNLKSNATVFNPSRKNCKQQKNFSYATKKNYFL